MAISPYFQQQGMNPMQNMQQGYMQNGYLPGERPEQEQFGQEPDFWSKLGTNLKEYIFGKSAGLQKIRNYEPHQISILNQLAGGGLNQYQNPYEGFQGLASETRRRFNEETVPSLAERFTSLGGGRLSSPAFVSQLGSAGAGLESMLNAQKANYGFQNRTQGLSALQQGLTPQFSYYGTPEQEGVWQKGEKLAGNIAQAGVKYLTGGLL